MSAIFVALLAATPLVSASNAILRRQATSTYAGDDYNPSQCFYPSTLSGPTDYPTPPPDLEGFLASATDACALNTAPATITSEFSSWTSAYMSWVTAHSATLNSIESFVSSYEASISTQSQCASYYNSLSEVAGSTMDAGLLFPTDGVFGTCSTGTGAGVAASTTSGASASMASSALPMSSSGSAAASSSSKTSAAGSSMVSMTGSSTSATAASTGSSSTAASSSGTNAGVSMYHSSGAVSTYFLVASATVAFSAFVGMIAL